MNLARRATAEAVGTAFLLAAVVGSGVMAERLAGGNVAIALLANAIATGGALVAIILAFGPISGAHLNPVVTIADAWQRGLAWRDVPAYIGAQLVGALVGVATANAMFGLPPIFVSHHVRTGGSAWLGEFVATFGLLAVIWGLRSIEARRDALCGRGLHRRRILVYIVDVFRKSGGDDRAIAKRYLYRYSSDRRRAVHRRAARRCGR